VTTLAPLDDPRYVPRTAGGRPRARGGRQVGPRSQIRWFRRFREQVGSQTIAVWDATTARRSTTGVVLLQLRGRRRQRGLFPDGCCCLDERV